MIGINDATNISLPFDEFKPSSHELEEVLSKCLSYYGLSLDKIDPEIFNVEDTFYVLSKEVDRYTVLFYEWIDRKPKFFTIENDTITTWSEDKIIDFVLNFASKHPEHHLTPFNYREHCDSLTMEAVIWAFRSPMSRYIDDSLLEDERNLLYRKNMQAFLLCLYGYDFAANIKPNNELSFAEEPNTTEGEEQVLNHYEQ